MQSDLSLKRVLLIAILLSVSALVIFAITSSSSLVNLHTFTSSSPPPTQQQIFGPNIAYADHSATRCSIDIRGERYPITYLNESRQNPDATFYPGDGFYYLLRYTDRTQPEQCWLHTPIIESANLHLNHTGVYRGEERISGGQIIVPKIKFNTPVVHTGHNLSVELMKTNHYHYAERIPEDTCRHHCTWQNCPYLFYHHYTMYEEPFVSKKGDLTRAEKKSARGQSSGSTTDIWVANDWKGLASKKAQQPYCADMGKMRSLDLATSVGFIRNSGIINQPTYTWEIVKNNPASHNDTFVSYADPNSRKQFEERVEAMCHTDRLRVDSGCVYGTAEIMTHAEILCIYDDLRARGINFTAPPETGTSDGRYIIPENKCSSPVNQQDNISSGGTLFNFTIKGTYLTPFHTAGGINPLKAIKTVTEDFAPPMQNSTLHVVLSKPPLHHHDGQYNAKNQDGTYYHHDPLYIYHEPSWVWKDQRYKHINFTLQRYHNVLPTMDKFHCINTTETFPCEHWTRLPGLNSMWLNETIQYGNGDGMTTHNATVGFAFGEYDFFYEMRAFNLNRNVTDGNGTTSAVVVDYNPLYDMVYSYPVLRDGAEYTYDDRRGIVMKYAGSWQEDFWPHETVEKIIPKVLPNGTVVNMTIWVPSTPYSVLPAEMLVKDASNDADEQPSVLTDKILWPERRSLINGWKHQGVAYDYFAKPVEFATVEPHLLSEARDVTPGNITALWYNATTDPSSVMFAQDGYGVVLWDWPVGDYVFGLKDNTVKDNLVKNNTNTTKSSETTLQVIEQQVQTPLSPSSSPNSKVGAAKYENMSSHLATYSWDFAGKPETPLYQSLMRYTDVPFGKHIIIRSIDQNGTTQIGDTITLRVVPSWMNGTTSNNAESDSGVKVEVDNVDVDNINNNNNNTGNGTSITTEYLTNYIQDKITHDTSDNQVFIQTVLNDTHSMQQEWKSTSGFLDVIVLRTSVLFDDFTTTPEMIAAHQEYVETYYEEEETTSTPLTSSLPDNEIVEQVTDAITPLTEEVSSVLSEPPPPVVIPWNTLFPTVDKSPFDFFTDLLDSIIVNNDKDDDDYEYTYTPGISSQKHAIQTPYVQHPDKLNNNYGQPLSGINDEQTILALYSANNLESFRLNLPYHMGLGLPSPTVFYISINGGQERVFDSKYYTFGGLENITINARKDNTATVERDLGRLIIAQPENFGLIKKVLVNNVTIPINNCTHSNGCIVNIQSTNETTHVVLYNEWGGEAHSNSEPIVLTAPMIVEPPRWQIVMLAIVGLVLLYVGYKQIKKMNL